MFVTKGRVLVNELAPCPHNSGHWTIEGCQTSQFEQVVRLSLGSLGKVLNCEMTNLFGKDVDDWESYFEEGGHIYMCTGRMKPGKEERWVMSLQY